MHDVDAIAAVIAPFVDEVTCREQGRQRFQADLLKTSVDQSDLHYFVAKIAHQVVGNIAYIEPSHVMHYF